MVPMSTGGNTMKTLKGVYSNQDRCFAIMVYIKKLIPVVLLVLNPLVAQQRPGRWIDDDLYLIQSAGGSSESCYIIDGDNKVQRTIPYLRDATNFPIDSKYLRIDVFRNFSNQAQSCISRLSG